MTEKEKAKCWAKEMRRAKQRSSNVSAQLSTSPTKAEALLKDALDALHIVYKFQHPIGTYKFRIPDFYFPRGASCPLIVEVDGKYHDTEEQREKDLERETWLKSTLGCTIVRYTNEDVLKDHGKIAMEIFKMGVLLVSVDLENP